MNKENPKKYSLQLTTLESIEKISNQEGISVRQASFNAFQKIKKQKISCGFNLKSPEQFYSSLKRFKNERKRTIQKLF